jgi:hypothetical protein
VGGDRAPPAGGGGGALAQEGTALAFYTEHFGFVQRADNPGPEGRFLTMGFEGQDLEVLLWPGPPGQGDASASPAGALFLESDDLRQDVERLQANGVRFVQPAPEDYPYGASAADEALRCCRS